MRVFIEVQKLPKWIFIIIIPSFIIALVLVIHAYTNAVSNVEKNELRFAFFAIIIVEIVGIFFISTMRQIVRIDETGVFYRYPPFKMKNAHISITKIKNYDLVIYPHAYYGYHVGFWNILKREPSISTIGVSKAIRIGFQDGKTLLIGTQKPEDLLKALQYNIQRQDDHETH